MIDYTQPRRGPIDVDTPLPPGMQQAPPQVMRPAGNKIRELLQRLNGGGMQKPFPPQFIPQELRDRLQIPQQVAPDPEPPPPPPKLHSVLKRE